VHHDVWVGSEAGVFSSNLEKWIPPGLGVHLALGDLAPKTQLLLTVVLVRRFSMPSQGQ
jgi:hypothetical protein